MLAYILYDKYHLIKYNYDLFVSIGKLQLEITNTVCFNLLAT